MPEISIRPLFGDDVEFIRRIRNANRKFFLHDNIITKRDHKTWIKKESVSNKNFIFIIDLIEKKVPVKIGTISLVNYDLKNKTAELGRFVVSKTYRGFGFGSLAIKTFKEMCKQIHIKKLFLTIKRNNADALNVYKKEGFKIIKINKKKIFMVAKI